MNPIEAIETAHAADNPEAEKDLYPLLGEEPIESVAPYINPPMDPGYELPPVDPVPFVDPFADIAQRAQEKIPKLFHELRQLPWQVVQSSQKKLMAMSNARQLSAVQKHLLMACVNPKSNPLECLDRCSMEELNALAEALQELARRKMPLSKSLQLEQEQRSLQILYQILEAESFRRNP